MSVQEYFLGGTSPRGFRTTFGDQISRKGFYTYILKGGPGTGKSTLMKKAAERLGGQLSVYRCSSDISSLDAVVAEDRGVIIVDGTSPHVFDARFPGISQELVDLGRFWDKEKLLSHQNAIRYCFEENAEYHRRVRSYVRAFSAVNTDIYVTAEECLDKLKLRAYINRLMKKLVRTEKKYGRGSIDLRQLSAFTTENYLTLPIVGDYFVYFIRDDNFAGSDLLLREVAERLVSLGYDIIVSRCEMLDTPAFEHLICEELKIAFVTGNFFNRKRPEDESIINFTRFYDRERLSRKKQRLSFGKKASAALADEAAVNLNTALRIHDELEKYYIDAVDFERLSEFTEEFLDNIAG